ncbi:hypothetical protein FHU33_4087 [Blastococcus colisei]|uniref:Uncharacterized protein n=1 Tax=Blastococcus colisei TaxID=1564162 RepID=A0A543P007_9ACTN|nr:hypothetical protein FHU33_4087 [Blastococcus colisei]
MTIKVDPVAKSRQTRSDKWKQRPAVMRYRAYADELRLTVPVCYQFPANVELIYGISMPRSWSAKKKAEMDGQPHRQEPDTNNLTRRSRTSSAKRQLCLARARREAVEQWSETDYLTIRPL